MWLVIVDYNGHKRSVFVVTYFFHFPFWPRNLFGSTTVDPEAAVMSLPHLVEGGIWDDPTFFTHNLVQCFCGSTTLLETFPTI